MSLRWRLLLAFSATTLVAVAVVSAVATRLVRDSFLRADRDRIERIVTQAQAAIARRGEQAARRVAAAAESEAITRMAVAVNASENLPALGAFVAEAGTLARAYELELLEIVGGDAGRTILSSAQWEARAGYHESPWQPGQPLVRLEELPAGTVLAVEAVREVNLGPRKLYLLGGYSLEAALIDELGQAGMKDLALIRIEGNNANRNPELVHIAESVIASGKDYRGELADSSAAAAIPIRDTSGKTLGALVMTASGAERERLIRFLYATALLASGLGLAAALALSLVLAGRITAPVADLLHASREIAGGRFSHRLSPQGGGEMARLSEAFNQMAAHLEDHRERLIQAERVAAWRELARRLAHELKNPLFPLQLSIENLRRARQVDPAHFDEVFEEGTATLLTELEELKRIVGRFSDFAKMPQPEPVPTDLNTLLEQSRRLYEARIRQEKIAVDLRPPAAPVMAQADPQLMGQAIDNLVLNALDAMPGGGRLELRAYAENSHAVFEVADSGSGLTAEERERIFTPYYTTKQHGTGLGLAIVQSVVADHGGRITVESEPQKGTRFRVELKRAYEDQSPDRR